MITVSRNPYTRLFRTLLLITLVSSMCLSVSDADERFTGQWAGEIEMLGTALTMKVHLTYDGTDWRGTIDVPAQNVQALPLSDIQVKETEVTFAMQDVPGNPTFHGHLQADGIHGKFRQGSVELDFRLSRDALPPPRRPQEPRPPFPYEVEEVTFQNGAVHLAGTLTVPLGEGPFPAALLISGSGLQDRDQTLFRHKPFWVLADQLTRAGIAVLRVDDPGIGESTPHPEPPTTAVFATDAEAGVAFLQRDPRIRQIGLIGHSEGGAVATLVASRQENIGFVVLLAAPGVSGAELLRKQNERIFDAVGLAAEQKQTLLDILDQLFTAATAGIPEAARQEQVETIVRQQFAANGIPPEQQEDTHVQAAVEQVLAPWMRYFLAFDPRPALAEIQAPVLALNGELDVQVDMEQNLTAIGEALEKGGNERVTLHRLPKHNHLFQRAQTGLVNEYDAIEETISPEVLDLIQEWVLSVTE